MKNIREALLRGTAFLFVFSILCGGIYTIGITGVAQLIFPDKANGSIIEIDGKKYGSEFLGQQFSDENHMWGRVVKLDVTTFTDENGNPVMYGAPSNLSPASDEYEQIIKERVEIMKKANPQMDETSIPVDLVTGSGSGLDPHISIAAAEYQIPRLAQSNNMTEEEVENIIKECTNNKLLGILGEKTVNVLKVNLMLEGIEI